MKIYCAGKIKNSAWREQIFPEIRNVDLKTQFDSEAIIRKAILKEHDYVGPFLSPFSDEEKELNGRKLADICKRRIERCDLFYVFFYRGEELHAHATLLEIGYALGLGKFVALACQNFLSAEAWFLRSMVDWEGNCQTPKNGLGHAIESYQRNRK